MVKVYTKDGSAFHEPPYTEEEHAEISRWMNGGTVSYVRAPRPLDLPAEVRKHS